jgi:hypothetical protein
MPDRRRHRGPHPEDAVLFGDPIHLRKLALAAGDLAWLLGRRYAPKAALTLVGNRYQLHLRQRRALAHAVAAPEVARQRRQHQIAPSALTGGRLQVDAFNQIITIEVALAGGLLLRGHDRVWRDLASVHGTYRQVQETHAALKAIGDYLTALGVSEVVFLIDTPVSNSARLASRIRALAQEHNWPWGATLDANVDTTLRRTPDVVATSDSAILDRVTHWFDLAGAVVQQMTSTVWCVDLNIPPPHVD